MKDNRWGFFPGVSAGWNIMEEDFWKNSKISSVISNLKPRVSYGINGNVNGIGNFDIYGLYKKYDNYGGQTGYYNSTLTNTALKWEQSKSFEAGLDIGFSTTVWASSSTTITVQPITCLLISVCQVTPVSLA